MAVYSLQGVADDPVGTGDLAGRLGVTTPSAVKMGKRLAILGLATRSPRRGLRLTPAGRGVALSALRRRRVLETYLVERLGSPLAQVDEEASQLGHAISDEVVERMWIALGRPPDDAHGDPIPRGASDRRALDDLAVDNDISARCSFEPCDTMST